MDLCIQGYKHLNLYTHKFIYTVYVCVCICVSMCLFTKSRTMFNDKFFVAFDGDWLMVFTARLGGGWIQVAAGNSRRFLGHGTRLRNGGLVTQDVLVGI